VRQYEKVHRLLTASCHDDGIRRFADNIAVLTKGYADGGGGKRGSVVNTITQLDRFCRFGFFSHQFQFLFRALAKTYMLNSDLLAKIAHFGFSVTGY
jgi:hypothetical protein